MYPIAVQKFPGLAQNPGHFYGVFIGRGKGIDTLRIQRGAHYDEIQISGGVTSVGRGFFLIAAFSALIYGSLIIQFIRFAFELVFGFVNLQLDGIEGIGA
jgi:hypothetical protein